MSGKVHSLVVLGGEAHGGQAVCSAYGCTWREYGLPETLPELHADFNLHLAERFHGRASQ